MISFIVIGKNEGWRLTKCLESIYKTVEADRITDFEVIYVDSKSTDNSASRAKAYIGVKVYSITGVCNAAIARNIGAKEAQGDVLFFIDGDMEIESGFLPKVITNNQLVYPFLSGICVDYNYNSKWELVNIKPRNTMKGKQQKEFTTGGLFIISRELWQSAGGMDTRFKRSQDLDLGLRLAKKGYPLVRKNTNLAKHHTLPYTSNTRYFESIGYFKYTALLFRKHVFSKYYLRSFIRTQYSFLALLFSLILLPLSYYLAFFYVTVIIIRSIKVHSSTLSSVYKHILFYLGRDFVILFSILFYYPIEPKPEYISSY